MKNDSLKKHHFWILLTLVPVLVGLLLIMILIFPGAAIADEETKYKASADAVANAKAQGVGMLAELTTQKQTLETRREQLWGINYERQKASGVFAWPYPDPAKGDQYLKALEKQDLRFGAKEVPAIDATKEADTQYVVLNDEMKKFTDGYYESYAALAKSVGPSRFDGTGWQSVLRYVTDWGTGARPESNPFWLALEDYWIQRALLKPIAEVNATAAKFVIVPPAKGPDTPLKRKFQNRTWEIDIELVQEGANRVLKSKLKNRTDRLQMLGLNKTMRLKVWLDDPNLTTSQPFEYRIGGELVKGSGELTPKVIPELHKIPAGADPIAIYKVEQILDEITVPVRLIRRVELGYRDAKRYSAELKQPSFFPEDTPPPGDMPNSMPPGMPTGMPPGKGDMYPGGTGASTAGARTGTAEQVLLGNKKRYIERTEQVRRMPVGLDLVVDQAYVNDVLIELGNSPLRFQVTQSQWQRFRDSLPATAGAVPMGGGEEPMGMPPGMPPAGVPGVGGPGAALPSSQVTAGLVELAVYGIVSLYEKAKVKPAEKVEPEPMKEPDPKKEPKPGDPPTPSTK